MGRRRKARRLEETGVYRVEHPAIDHGARYMAWLAIGLATLALGFTVTILAWAMWTGGAA